jgi:hypothetical protein
MHALIAANNFIMGKIEGKYKQQIKFLIGLLFLAGAFSISKLSLSTGF